MATKMNELMEQIKEATGRPNVMVITWERKSEDMMHVGSAYSVTKHHNLVDMLKAVGGAIGTVIRDNADDEEVKVKAIETLMEETSETVFGEDTEEA